MGEIIYQTRQFFAIFRYWGDDLAKLTRVQMSFFFAQNEVKTKKKIIMFPDAQFFAQNEVKTKKRSSRLLMPSFGT